MIDNGGLDCSSSSRSDEKWSNFGYVLNVSLIELVSKLEMEFERRRRVRMILRFLVWESRDSVIINWNRKFFKWNSCGSRVGVD